ncbi:hypothetical protein [Nostoc sp. LPT]|uniref:hypothetical protein n=1 Tax=Nostoc sp. LPT TaxID=2815387 RepID=UPI001DE46C8B|nr:hypothetical protein [Nostoc sp. LPT]MBN4005852.1 hypothetical protein [Nostoc sp. LPT]
MFTTTIVGISAITAFNSYEGDKIVLDKTTFGVIAFAAGTGFTKRLFEKSVTKR